MGIYLTFNGLHDLVDHALKPVFGGLGFTSLRLGLMKPFFMAQAGGLAFILFYVLFQVFSGHPPVSSLFVGAEASVVCS